MNNDYAEIYFFIMLFIVSFVTILGFGIYIESL